MADPDNLPGVPDPARGPSPVPAGVLVVDKPRGPSSMQAVARIRGRVREALRRSGAAGVRRPKVGHAGTLDPLADGVLLVGVGAATRELGRLMGLEKRYRTVVDLGAFTDTDDAEGVRESVEVAEPPSRERVEAAVAGFLGTVLQRPPAFSAVKLGGRRAYELARSGAATPIEARPVQVHDIGVLDYQWPRLTVDIRCGKGFYIRSFARDLGERLGTGGTCLAIQRRAIGPFEIGEAVPLDDLPEAIGPEDLMSIDEAVSRAVAHEHPPAA
ncbi:MAG: tRNA pseudouridine(55) synthase TruB [Planctomycetota bacterium]